VAPARLRFWPQLAPAAAGALLYLTGLEAVGLLGPDEPRYAAIAQEMARSGDWITPRLWGEGWFEKPPLAYWMMGLGFRLGLGAELAPRLPMALASLAFLVFYYCRLQEEFGARAAGAATLILGTSAGWLVFSRVGVTDLPMAAAFSCAMLLGLPWLARGEARGLPWAAFLLGLAVLAKGLVPLALAAPLLLMGRQRLRDWLRPAPLLAFLAPAAPWYLAMALRHGGRFLEEFFLKHHVARLWADQLQHVQPFWFYLPVLAAGLYPWTPLIALLPRRGLYRDGRVKFLLAWLLFGLVFFSAALNKLPGYLLPLLPAAAALLGLALAETPRARWALGACGLLLAAVPAAIHVLPGALVVGLRKAHWGEWPWAGTAAAAPLALWCWWWGDRRRQAALAALAAGVTAAVLWLEVKTFPLLDRRVSVRAFWRGIADASQVCIVEADRERRYGLAYYAGAPLPDCALRPLPLRIRERGDGSLELSAR